MDMFMFFLISVGGWMFYFDFPWLSVYIVLPPRRAAVCDTWGSAVMAVARQVRPVDIPGSYLLPVGPSVRWFTKPQE